MLRRILAIVRKDVLLNFASRSQLLFYVILPVVFTAILGGLTFGGGDDNRLAIAVVNEDDGALAEELLTALENSAAIRPDLKTSAEAVNVFESNDAPALLIIPAGFSDALRHGETVDLSWRMQSGNANALVAQQAVQAAVGQVSQAVTIANTSVQAAEQREPFAGEETRDAYFADSLAAAQEMLAAAPQRVSVTQPVPTAEADQGNSFNNAAQASAGQLITWVFIPLLGTAGLFAYERTQGTLRRLISTPTSKSTYLLGTISGQLGLGLVQMLLLVAFGALIFGLQWGQSPAALALMLFTFGLAAVAMGTMLGTFIKTDGQATGIAIMLGMVMALLGGCWYPLELFPPGVQTAVHVLPTTWAMQGLTDLVMWGQGFIDILPEAGVLLGFALVFFVIGVGRFRYE